MRFHTLVVPPIHFNDAESLETCARVHFDRAMLIIPASSVASLVVEPSVVVHGVHEVADGTFASSVHLAVGCSSLGGCSSSRQC